MGGAAGGAEALIVDRCAHHQEVAAGETSHLALITYMNLIKSDHMSKFYDNLFLRAVTLVLTLTLNV